jgi:nucleotide-binding universal stress UspA family protein
VSRVMVAIDGSAGARNALVWAFEEARLRTATLEVVHVYQPFESYPALGVLGSPGPPGRDPGPVHGEAERVITEALEGLEGIHDIDDGVTIERAAIGASRVAEALIERSRGADLLVVGSRGRGGFTGLLLGSVSQQCVQHARCPVAVVPDRAGLP